MIEVHGPKLSLEKTKQDNHCRSMVGDSRPAGPQTFLIGATLTANLTPSGAAGKRFLGLQGLKLNPTAYQL
jgi:hypothetical protein